MLRRSSPLAALALIVLVAGYLAAPAATETRVPCTEDAMIVFDASGSMAGNTVQGLFSDITRIDEVPQFINVLRGEMSMVGPRAERAQWVETFEQQIPFYRARLLVKPGISGWAQINYGYAATVEDTSVKLEYDLYYIKHRSVFMDIVILLRTVGTVLGRKGR